VKAKPLRGKNHSLGKIEASTVEGGAMFEHEKISIYKLKLDTGNYRIGKQETQKATRDAIIEEQGKKLVELAKDIGKYKLSPFDLPMVAPSIDIDSEFVMLEGNRRLTAIKLVLEPDLAKGTELHEAFKKLNKTYEDTIPVEIFCVVAPDKKAGLMWINRKHDKGLKGAGTEVWGAYAKMRADADQGKPAPTKDAVDFVEANMELDDVTKKKISGSKFPITNLSRLLETKYIRTTLGIINKEGRLSSTADDKWVLNVLKEMIVAIANESFEGEDFNESKIDKVGQRKAFINRLVEKHPRPQKTYKNWTIGGGSKVGTVKISKKVSPVQPKSTPSTNARPKLMPPSFRLKLPDGKVNNVYKEIRKHPVKDMPNAIAILLRVFFEFSVDDYIKKNKCVFKQKKGKDRDRLRDKIELVSTHMKDNKVMTKRELKPIVMI